MVSSAAPSRSMEFFAIPTNLGLGPLSMHGSLYTYTLLNAVFYANYIAYAAPTSLVTKGLTKERVQMGSFRFMFSFATQTLRFSLLLTLEPLNILEMNGGMENHCTHLPM